MELTTDQKGNVAELAVTLAATRLGIDVYQPIGEGGRYDLIFGIGPQLLRVQCKWAPRNGNVISVRLFSSRRTRAGCRRRLYTQDEIDAIAAYCEELDRCYFLPFATFGERTYIFLRTAPAANNQQTGVNWARDFELERVDWAALGAVAQLGERRAGSAKVTGSSPVGSTLEAVTRRSSLS